MIEVRNRYFVRGMSRSGGTLMATILDAHPEIAMGYELYEHLLEPRSESGIETIQDVIKQIHRLKQKPLNKFNSQQSVDTKIKTFAARVKRGGVDQHELEIILRNAASTGLCIQSTSHRLKIIECIVSKKMTAENKISWGSKIAKRYTEVERLWDNSAFVFMMRDGRDIAASRKKNGDFKQTIKEVATGYVSQIEQFKKFASNPSVNSAVVKYESLVTTPESTLRNLCEHIGLSWSDKLLSHHEADLTIYKNPTGHLSANQITQPINSMSIGRWKDELTSREVLQFEDCAGKLLEEYGYSENEFAS